nr:recombinase family protein [Candidimonas nitroreducens]
MWSEAALHDVPECAGELILAVLSQVADMERKRIAERTAAGREKAKADGKHAQAARKAAACAY